MGGCVCVCVNKGCRYVKQGDSDSDGSAGHVWPALMDASGTVISKAFQGRHDRALYVYVCVWVQMHFACFGKGGTCPRLTHKNQQVFYSFSLNI